MTFPSSFHAAQPPCILPFPLKMCLRHWPCQYVKNFFISFPQLHDIPLYECTTTYLTSSVQFSRSVVSDSLRPHGSMPGLPVHHQLLESTQTVPNFLIKQLNSVFEVKHIFSTAKPCNPPLFSHLILFLLQLSFWMLPLSLSWLSVSSSFPPLFCMP